VPPDLSRVSAAGHSFGGVLSANYASIAAANGLPQPQSIFCAHPGALYSWLWGDYSLIPAGTLIVSVAGEQDTVASAEWARQIVDGATAVSAGDKDFVLIRGDAYGSPPLVTQHGAPTGFANGTGVDALDTHGYWKWCDALTDAAWYGTHRACALGDTPEQRFMGRWSDGTPVVEPVVTD
jgi:hypothetical protein